MLRERALAAAEARGAAAAARGGGDARGDGASVGEKLAGCWRSARGVFGGDAWERRRDPYVDVDAFERADFD